MFGTKKPQRSYKCRLRKDRGKLFEGNVETLAKLSGSWEELAKAVKLFDSDIAVEIRII